MFEKNLLRVWCPLLCSLKLMRGWDGKKDLKVTEQLLTSGDPTPPLTTPQGALAAAKADAASGYVDRIHYTIDNEGATVLPTLLGALDTHNVMFAFGYPQIANDLGLVCTALAGHISAAANLYRQGALTGGACRTGQGRGAEWLLHLIRLHGCCASSPALLC